MLGGGVPVWAPVELDAAVTSNGLLAFWLAPVDWDDFDENNDCSASSPDRAARAGSMGHSDKYHDTWLGPFPGKVRAIAKSPMKSGLGQLRRERIPRQELPLPAEFSAPL